MTQDNVAKHKEIVHRVFSEVWTESDFRSITELIAPEMLYHLRGNSVVLRPEDLEEIVTRWKQAFPDLRFQVDDLVAEGDKVAARLSYRGTHKGEWKGMPPSGNRVHVQEMMFFRFESHRIVEGWEVIDEFSLRDQLGAGQS